MASLDNVFLSYESDSIRLGTFNVNGKAPSQDLSSWIQGNDTNVHDLKTIPPLKDISPLSMGEIARNPLDNAADVRCELTCQDRRIMENNSRVQFRRHRQ